jgi:two-component system KDP operon response regulator KdpE
VTSPRAAPLRIVIVDNDPDALDLLDLDLALEGHEIVGKGRGGDAAIELCRELRPDVLVVDFRMPPGPDGLEVAAALRGQPGLTTILYTNYRDPKNAALARRYGASYLLKGDLRTLRKALNDVRPE